MTYQDNNPNFHPMGKASAYSLNNPPQEPVRVRQNFTPVQQQAPQTYHPGRGTEAALEIKARCEGLWLGYVAYKSGTAYYEMHPDTVEAALHGAHALRRWWIWLFWFKVWLGTLAFLIWATYLKNHEIRGEDYNGMSALDDMLRKIAIWIIPATVCIAIMYTRNIDFALFKRRALYWVLRPVAFFFDWVPNWIVYMLVAFPLFGPWPMVG